MVFSTSACARRYEASASDDLDAFANKYKSSFYNNPGVQPQQESQVPPGSFLTDSSVSTGSDSSISINADEESDAMSSITTDDDLSASWLTDEEAEVLRKQQQQQEEEYQQPPHFHKDIAPTSKLVWADQTPNQSLVTVQDDWEWQQEVSIRIVFLLLDAETQQFEFVYGEMQTQQELLVCDLLEQLGRMATGSIWSKDNRQFTSLMVPSGGIEQEEVFSSASLSDMDLRNGEILTAVAIKKHASSCCIPSQVLKTARHLHSEKIKKSVRTACMVGRSLHTLYTSEQWAKARNDSTVFERRTFDLDHDDEDEDDPNNSSNVWIGVLLLHPATQQFEVLHCQYTGSGPRVADLLAQLPGLALSRPTFTDTTFDVLLADNNGHMELSPVMTLQECMVQKGDVLIALAGTAAADTATATTAANHALQKTRRFLTTSHNMFRFAVKRAYKSGRDRDTLLNSEQWASVQAEKAQEADATASSSSSSNASSKEGHKLEQHDTLLSKKQFMALCAAQPNGFQQLGDKTKRPPANKKSSSTSKPSWTPQPLLLERAVQPIFRSFDEQPPTFHGEERHHVVSADEDDGDDDGGDDVARVLSICKLAEPRQSPRTTTATTRCNSRVVPTTPTTTKCAAPMVGTTCFGNSKFHQEEEHYLNKAPLEESREGGLRGKLPLLLCRSMREADAGAAMEQAPQYSPVAANNKKQQQQLETTTTCFQPSSTTPTCFRFPSLLSCRSLAAVDEGAFLAPPPPTKHHNVATTTTVASPKSTTNRRMVAPSSLVVQPVAAPPRPTIVEHEEVEA